MRRNFRSAFTLIEVLMTISLVAILSVAGVSLFNSSLDDARFDATYKEMLQLRKGLIGDLENTTIEGERIRFGYLGDMGAIPTESQGLSAVYAQPSGVASWAVNASANLGVGWNGPYIVSSTSEDFYKDAWGRDYIYITSVDVPYILSFGADGVEGGTGTNQDIQIDLPLDIRTATVTGQITNAGSVYEGSAYVEIFYPTSNGAISSQSVALLPADSGQYTFSSIPFGLRSVKVYVPNSASPQFIFGPVAFAVDNQNYFIQSTAMEVNPVMTNANCNTVNNVSFIPGSLVIDEDADKASWRMNIERSFSIDEVYTTNRVNGGIARLNQIGIGGVVYGCSDIIDHFLTGTNLITFDRRFTGCDGKSGKYNVSHDPNIELQSAWGIAAGNNVQAFMDFDTNILQSDVNFSITMRLGCDEIEIVP